MSLTVLTLLRRADIVAVFAHRSYRCLAAAYLISIVGDAVYFVAVPWHVLNEQGLGASLSFGSAASLVLTAATIPILIMPPLAGVLADRMDRKFLMLFSHVVRMLILAVLIVLGQVGELNTLVLAVAAFLLTSAGQLFYPARAAMLPNLLPRKELVAGNVALAAGHQPINITKSAAVGFLIAAVGGLNAIGVALVAYGLAAWLLSRIEAPEQNRNLSTAGMDAKPHAWPFEMVKVGTRDLAYSVYFIVGHPLLRAIAIAGMMLTAFRLSAISMAVPAYFRDVLGEGPGSVNTFTAIQSVGMILALLAVPWVARRYGDGKISLLALSALGVLVGGLAAVGQLWQGLAVAALMGVLIAGMLPLGSIVQAETPDHLRGRVVAVLATINILVALFVGLCFVALMELTGTEPGPRLILLATGIVVALSGVVLLKLKEIRLARVATL